MSVSKYVEEVLETLRTNLLLSAHKGGVEVEVSSVDPYPEDTDVVIGLANGKNITTQDLEFSDIVDGNIVLGDYLFTLKPHN
jgi:hypothetical protein